MYYLIGCLIYLVVGLFVSTIITVIDKDVHMIYKPFPNMEMIILGTPLWPINLIDFLRRRRSKGYKSFFH